MKKINPQLLVISLLCIFIAGVWMFVVQSPILKNSSEMKNLEFSGEVNRESDRQPSPTSFKSNERSDEVGPPNVPGTTGIVRVSNNKANSSRQKISPQQAEKELLERANVRDDRHITIEKLADGTEIFHANGSFQHVSSASLGEDGEVHVDCDHSHEDEAGNNTNQEPRIFTK